MRVLVYEHLSSLPTGNASLRAEGQAMLTAVLADLAACPGVEPVTLVEPSLVEVLQTTGRGAEIRPVAPDGVEQLFRRLAREAAFSLVIAPEFDDLLAVRCEWALAEGSRLLGPTPEAVRLCGDKLRLAGVLKGAGVTTPLTEPYEQVGADWPFPRVCKPRWGAGAQATYLIHTPESFRQVPERAIEEGWIGPLIVQPACPGLAASIAVVSGPAATVVLGLCEQRVEVVPIADWSHPEEGQLRYRGGQVPFVFSHRYTWLPGLVDLVRSAIPGLAGYFGIDLVLTGKEDWVIEINPRLTTSYVGLRRLALDNLMQLLLDVVQGKPVAPPTWRGGAVRFKADGTIE